jgi:hypothetical protein
VLPLALFAVIVLALLVALLLDAAVQDMRIARGDAAEARARGAVETAMADLLRSVPESSLLSVPGNVVRRPMLAEDADSAFVTLQPLGAATVRAVVTARGWAGPMRADAGAIAFLRVVRDSGAVGGPLSFRRLPGWWWAPNP